MRDKIRNRALKKLARQIGPQNAKNLLLNKDTIHNEKNITNEMIEKGLDKVKITYFINGHNIKVVSEPELKTNIKNDKDIKKLEIFGFSKIVLEFGLEKYKITEIGVEK